MNKVIIYTDGSIYPNPGVGGWAAVLLWKDVVHEISGGEKGPTTNNRMEMLALVEALKLLQHPCKVTVYTDSQYLQRGVGDWNDGKPGDFRGYMVKWKSRGWMKTDKGEILSIKNVDLWKQLYDLTGDHARIRMKWVKGHSGDPYNERCDVLASEARKVCAKT